MNDQIQSVTMEDKQRYVALDLEYNRKRTLNTC
jgi:hypothetical protein